MKKVFNFIENHKFAATIIAIVLLAIMFAVNPEYVKGVADVADKIGGILGGDFNFSFNEHEVNVILDSNGGTLESNSIVVMYGKEYGVLPNPQKNDMTFMGWYTESGEQITRDSKVTTLGEHTLYARWGVEIKFSMNDGYKSNIDSYYVACGDKYGELPVPENDGAKFLGWYTTPECTKKVTFDTIVTAKKPHTLYAKWDYYYLTFTNNDDGTYSVRGNKARGLPKEILIPATYLGKKVITIESRAFESWSEIEVIVIPQTITTIGDYAFPLYLYPFHTYAIKFTGSKEKWNQISKGDLNGYEWEIIYNYVPRE